MNQSKYIIILNAKNTCVVWSASGIRIEKQYCRNANREFNRSDWQSLLLIT